MALNSPVISLRLIQPIRFKNRQRKIFPCLWDAFPGCPIKWMVLQVFYEAPFLLFKIFLRSGFEFTTQQPGLSHCSVRKFPRISSHILYNSKLFRMAELLYLFWPPELMVPVFAAFIPSHLAIWRLFFAQRLQAFSFHSTRT